MTKQNRSRSRMTFTTEGWIFLVILAFVTVGAILRNVNLLIVMSGMMFAPLLLSWRIGTHVVRHVRARRIIPTRIHVGQIVNFQWELSNLSRLPIWSIVIQDELVFEEDPNRPDGVRKRRNPRQRTQVTFNFVGIGQTEYMSYQCLFWDRGIYRVGPARVFSRYPFGLIKSWFGLPDPVEFHVAPRLGKLHPSWERRIASHVVGADSVRRKRGMDEDEFYALRAWRAGDSLRQIHWRTTAKSGELMVKQFDQKTHRDIAIALDLRSTRGLDSQAFDTSERDRIETLLSFAATLLARLGHDCPGKVALAIAGRETWLGADRLTPDFFSRAMRRLATAQAHPDTEIVAAVQHLYSSVAAGTPLFVFSARDVPVDWLMDQLPERQRNVIGPWLHWVPVDSESFHQIFTPDEEAVQRAVEVLKREAVDASA